MAIVFDKDKAYMEALKKFRKLIDTKYRDGGWLPSSRVMCELLNISSVTYVKVTNRLAAEHILKSYPRKGIYVLPEKYRIKKIGVVVGSGEESPFLGEGGLLAAILNRIDQCGFAPHMIQASPITNIPRNALSHFVNGIIWNNPPETATSVMTDLHQSGLLPIVAVTPLTPSSESDLYPGIPSVSEDFLQMGPKIAEMFLARGHKKLIYAGNYWFAEHCGMVAALNNGGVKFNESNCLGNYDFEPGELTAVLQRHKATGLIFEGRDSRLENAFKELSELSEHQSPEMLIRISRHMPELCREYSRLKIIGVAACEIKKLGPVAVDLVNQHLMTGRELCSKKISTYKIIRDIKSLIKEEIVA